MQEYEPGRTVFKKEKSVENGRHFMVKREIFFAGCKYHGIKIAAQRVFLQPVRQNYEKQKSRDGLYHSF